ncbi:MAG TPA: outer membrane protein assembly factor BamD [Candidatus Aquilonibacter sp.]|nr:outer membrane protein assembly factor BamD [Candidatus Aquilonibacter sp.]
MFRRIPLVVVVSMLLWFTAACTNKKVVNPLAGIGSKQPDKVLFDRSMDAMKHNRFDVARMTLQTLITTYPDSEYVARAKLAVGDSWYAEGGTASLAQAEQEYRDFITFFPNMPEAAEAQLKIANIQYQQMEKADRDYTHAKRAEDEYRNLIMQFPDSKLVPEAKQRLLEVQEVLAEREFDIGRFYYLRESYPASIARLQSLIDQYPLYSKADEALFLLGQDYEGQIAMLRSKPTCTKTSPVRGCVTENAKADYIEAFTKDAAAAYDKIITRYPAMNREDDAKRRLEALHQPVPRPTKAALAQNRAEEDSRREPTTLGRLMSVVKKGPDVSEAAKVGQPTLVDPTPLAARDVVTTSMRQAMGIATGERSLSVETVKGVAPGPNEPAPRSDAPAAAGTAAAASASDSSAASASAGGSQPFARPAATTNDPNELKPNTSSDANELTPNVGSDSNELKPATASSDQALPPPVQVNEIQPGQSSNTATATSPSSSLATDQEISSSKKKKKKGLKKLDPF